MFGNYIKLAFRNLKKDKGFSAINIFGLALGLATCLLITLFVVDELSYDRYNTNADRIYRISADIHINGNTFNSTSTPFPMGIALVKDYPAIEKAVRFGQPGDMLVKKGTETIMEQHAVFADSTLFDVFSLSMIAGNPRTALVQPYSMVISETMARKYFNSIDVVGKSLLTSNTVNYKITGVIRDMPTRSHFHFNFIKAMSELTYSRDQSWLNNNCVTYVLVRPGTSVKQLNSDINGTINKYIAPQLQSLLHSSLDNLAKNGNFFKYPVMPLNDIHLHSNQPDEFEANGDIEYVSIFIIIAIFI
jgi:putative ABC transport system permease protein